MKKLIEYGTLRLAAAADGKDFFQAVPREFPEGNLTAWYLRNFDRILNTDCAKMAFFSQGYRPQDPESVKKFHQAAAVIMQDLIEHMLSEITPGDTVIFMAGGNGSGKSTFCSGIKAHLGKTWVIDATLASITTARDTIKKVLDLGGKAVIIHIIRDKEDAWENGVMKRAAHGSHCTPRNVFNYTHLVVAGNVAVLEQEFANRDLKVYRIANPPQKVEPPVDPHTNSSKAKQFLGNALLCILLIVFCIAVYLGCVRKTAIPAAEEAQRSVYVIATQKSISTMIQTHAEYVQTIYDTLKQGELKDL